ncbi:type II TA system antitoxin MqsA family protein [Legionella feeleii]|uniref:Antitoxin MqsA n=1 Tax=Legionella feeleii TaxID=453 RepID=A0A0W0U8S3_9GAMM|nr:type II TA system antitoxin MqsA family protein [Legionella feeleii]KTD04175.1 Antitoxin MqsA [Legionella feeleii]SPX60713.1 Antitoxin MqsA [Legionella feeleii]
MTASKEKQSKFIELTPEDIRLIRESLGLSQAEAGELIGGGPRAFSKYENGIIRPASSIQILLRLLKDDPSAINRIAGRKIVPIDNDSLLPFECSKEHIAALNPYKFTQLIRRLLNAEAHSNNIQKDGIHVASIITAPDGGEDARIEWSGGPEHTKYLPSRLCQFQLKATDINSKKAGKDVLTSAGNAQPMITSVLEAGGAYIMLCARACTKRKIQECQEEIITNLCAVGLNASNTNIKFLDADQIANWVNNYPSVATWVLEQTHTNIAGPFRTLEHWAGRYEYNSIWVTDSRLIEIQKRLQASISIPQSVIRIVGPSGIGKSRLVLEALGSFDLENEDNSSFQNLVLYGVESEIGSQIVKQIIQNLVDIGTRLVIVVDQCVEETHLDLVSIAKRSGSKISLVTIDYEIPNNYQFSNDIVLVGTANSLVIDGIIKNILPNLPAEDHQRLVKFSNGFPQIAQLIASTWNRNTSISSASDSILIEKIILGRNPHRPELLQIAAQLLSVFGLLGIKKPLDSDLKEIIVLAHNYTIDDLYVAFESLCNRQVAQQRGRLIILQPIPVALNLAEKQWNQWSQDNWDEVLTGSLNKILRKRAARQLALLNTTRIAKDVVKHVCRFDGPLYSLEKISLDGNMEVLSCLAEVDAEVVVTVLDNVINSLSLSEIQLIPIEVRRYLIWALEKIAFVENTFEDGANLLLKLALTENKFSGNDATTKFKSLFPVSLANTETGPELRLQFLDNILTSSDSKQLLLATEALLEGTKTDSLFRWIGPEIQGSRPVLKSWAPACSDEVLGYVKECANRVVRLAIRNDEIGERARSGLGSQFRIFILRGLIIEVEKWVDEVSKSHSYWPEALDSLNDALKYDLNTNDNENYTSVKNLTAKLAPSNINDRLRFLVTEMPWDYPANEKLDFEERSKRQIETIEQLVRDLMHHEVILLQFLPELSSGSQRMAVWFGRALAKYVQDSTLWERHIIGAIESVVPANRNFSLLAGYYATLAKKDPHAYEKFKQRASTSPDLAPGLPLVFCVAGICEHDIILICKLLKDLIIPSFAIHQWAYGGVLSKLSPKTVALLFDQLFKMDSQYYFVGLNLMSMYTHDQKVRLENLRPQLINAAEYLGQKLKTQSSFQRDSFEFIEMIKWLLLKGAQDTDAQVVAKTLAKHLVIKETGLIIDFIKPLLPILLADFSQIVWPIISKTIISDKINAWHLELALGSNLSFDNSHNPPILSLPKDMLYTWCHAHGSVGAAFIASIIPVLENQKSDISTKCEFHQITKWLIDEFGEYDDVLRALDKNMHTFSWSGAPINYYIRYEYPFTLIKNHPKGKVRQWVKRTLTNLKSQIDSESIREEEQGVAWDN